MDRPLKLHDLRRILHRFGVEEDPRRGKGSHTLFFKRRSGGVVSFPIPTSGGDVPRQYVRALRRRFGLTAEDGVADADFYRS